MKLNLVMLSALATVGFALEPARPAVAPTVPLVVQDKVTTTAEFLNSMRKAMEIGAADQIVTLVRRHEEIASWAVIELCQAYSGNPSERLDEEIDALRVAWNKAVKTEYVERMYEYFSLMDGTTRVERSRAVSTYNAHNKARIKAEADKDMKALLDLIPKFKTDVEALKAVGDMYYLGQAWLALGRLNDEQVRGDNANFDEAARAYFEVVKAREAIELEDLLYHQCKARAEVLAKRGATVDPANPGAKKKPAASTLGQPIVVPMTFRAEGEITDYQRPIWSNDEAYTSWSSFYLSPAVTTAKIGNMPLADVTRTGPTSFGVTSGDFKADFLMNGKFVPVEIQLNGPNGSYPWAFIGVTGTSQDTYQGVQVNLEPSDTGLTVYIAPAAVLEGEVNGESIQVFDDSMSGVWGDAPTSWGYVGLTEGHFQWDMDSVVIGKGKKALPWSRYQKIGDTWYDLKIEGMQLTAQPVELSTGELKLSFKGTKPNYLVLQGEGPYADCYFDLTAEKAIEVPVGQYKLLMGGLSKGKRVGIQKVLILPGKTTPLFTAIQDETTEVKLGGPFKFDFEAEDLGDSVRFIGHSLVVTGVAGERYERPWNNRPFPEGSLRKLGSKRGGKPERLFSQVDQDTLYKDWNNGYFPADLIMAKPKGAEEVGVEAQITEKKNDLFGKLESDWITPKQ